MSRSVKGKFLFEVKIFYHHKRKKKF